LPENSANQKPFPDGSNANTVGILPPVGIIHSLRFALVVRPWTCLTDGATDTRTIKITKIAKLLGTIIFDFIFRQSFDFYHNIRRP
jgi:hypothetical protein